MAGATGDIVVNHCRGDPTPAAITCRRRDKRAGLAPLAQASVFFIGLLLCHYFGTRSASSSSRCSCSSRTMVWIVWNRITFDGERLSSIFV